MSAVREAVQRHGIPGALAVMRSAGWNPDHALAELRRIGLDPFDVEAGALAAHDAELRLAAALIEPDADADDADGEDDDPAGLDAPRDLAELARVGGRALAAVVARVDDLDERGRLAVVLALAGALSDLRARGVDLA